MSVNAKNAFYLLVCLLATMLIGAIVIRTIISNVNATSWSTEVQAQWNNFAFDVRFGFILLVILVMITGAVILLRYIGVIGG